MELLRSWTEKLRPAADPESPLKYEPLTSPKEIRLIEIQSGYAMIKCSLYHAIYDEAEYHAVSYTWGDPRPWQSFEESKAWEQADEYWVSCNGQKLQVARNLHDLLTSLRAKRYFKTPIWVDSICINQADLDERSHQVAQMGEIYSHAYGSIVWLGMEDDEITVPTCAFIKSFGKALGDHPEEKVCSFSWDHPRLYEMIEHPPVTTEQWSLLAQFCSRRWFGRGWVLRTSAARI